MTTLAQPIETMQTLDMDGHDTAWLFGFEDGRNAVSEFNGYTYFIGHNLSVYREAHAAGLAQRHMLQSGQVVEPDEAQAMDEALEIIRSQGKTESAWYAQVEDEQIGAEYSAAPFLF